MKNLTDRQKELLRFITSYTESQGYPPTLAEMAENLSIRNINAVQGHLAALERKGYIVKEAGASRALKVRGWTKLLDATVGRLQGRHGRQATTALGMPRFLLGWLTRGGKPLLAETEARAALEKSIRQVAIEHGWRIERIVVHADRVTMAIAVTPDHSPAAIVTHFHWYFGFDQLLQGHLRGLKSLWGKSFAAATNEAEFDACMAELKLQEEGRK